MTTRTPIDDEAAVATEPEIKGTRLRVTSIDKWLECGVREARYESREWRIPEWPYTMRGRIVHAARAHYLKTFQKTQRLPDLDDVEGFAEAFAAGEIEKDDASIQANASKPVWDEARVYVQADALGVLPRIAPHVFEVEKRLDLRITGEGILGDWILSGQPDALAHDPTTGRITMPDLKTGGRAQSAAEVNASTQLTAYALLVREKHGQIPLIAHHAVRVLKNPPKRILPSTTVVELPAGGFGVTDVIHTERVEADLLAVLRRVRVVIDAREQNFLMPAAGGFSSPCHRCVHRGHADGSQRCEFASSARMGEEAHDVED